MRHSLAEDYSSAGSDSSRRLTEAGHVRAKAAAAFVEQKGLYPTKLFHSTLERARQTAALNFENLGRNGTTIELRAVDPSARREERSS